MCELLAQTYICHVDFFADYPNKNEANDRIDAILYHLREVLRHADFDGDHNRRKNFWVTVFIDGNGVLPPDRWFGWSKFARSMEAAHHHLRRFAERRLQALQFENVGGSSALENGYLKQLSCAYYHILKRKPGRSKSTIGPFVRFAWAAMAPVLDDHTPTIETLNERWARLKYDPVGTKLSEEALQDLKATHFW
jgi:hypothetical protein